MIPKLHFGFKRLLISIFAEPSVMTKDWSTSILLTICRMRNNLLEHKCYSSISF